MININAYCFGYLGVQKHGRNFIQALSRYDDIALFPYDLIPLLEEISPFFQQCLINAQNCNIDRNIGIGIGVMNRMPFIVGRKKIAFTVWETSKIPTRELEYLSQVDEIWIPSTWGKENLEQNGIPSKQIKVVPEGVDPHVYKPIFMESQKGPRVIFRFLCIGKWEKRKGIDVLLKAYSNEFKPEEPVELIIHCHNPNIPHLSYLIRHSIAAMKLPDHPPIKYSPPVDESTLVKLYNSCDAFVLPTRAEGWGLTILEAMACGKPVIITNYGAHLDFANDKNSYLIDVKEMVRVYDPHSSFEPTLEYGEWAEPDQAHLQWLLRYVFQNQQKSGEIGQQARIDVVNQWTWKHSSAKAWKLLQRF